MTDDGETRTLSPGISFSIPLSQDFIPSALYTLDSQLRLLAQLRDPDWLFGAIEAQPNQTEQGSISIPNLARYSLVIRRPARGRH